MTNEEALKFIEERLLEISFKIDLPLNKAQEDRINKEASFLTYVRGLCERAEPLNVCSYDHPISVTAFDGTDNVFPYKYYPCPHCGAWVYNNKNHCFCERCGQALNFPFFGGLI